MGPVGRPTQLRIHLCGLRMASRDQHVEGYPPTGATTTTI